MANMIAVREMVKHAWVREQNVDSKYVDVNVYTHATTLKELQLDVDKFHYWIGGVNDRITYAYCEERVEGNTLARYTLFSSNDGYPFYYGDLDNEVLAFNIVKILSQPLTQDNCDFKMHWNDSINQWEYDIIAGERVE